MGAHADDHAPPSPDPPREFGDDLAKLARGENVRQALDELRHARSGRDRPPERRRVDLASPRRQRNRPHPRQIDLAAAHSCFPGSRPNSLQSTRSQIT
jgi:hypothetical protein